MKWVTITGTQENGIDDDWLDWHATEYPEFWNWIKFIGQAAEVEISTQYIDTRLAHVWNKN